MEKQVLIFAGPSGSGKGTLCHYILHTRYSFSSALSISCTTRPPRFYEKESVHYYFLSQEEFMKMVAQGKFLEWEEVYPGVFYGTLRSEIERLIKSEKIILFDVDVEGAVKLKAIFGDKALAVFVKPPSMETLEARLVGRNSETEEKRKERLAKARWEMEQEYKFDITILNDDLDRAKRDVRRIIRYYFRRNFRFILKDTTRQLRNLFKKSPPDQKLPTAPG